MSRMYPHTATVWMRLPEVDRQAAWQLKVLDGVRWEGSRGASVGTDGNVSADNFLLLVPNVFTGFVPYEELTKERTLETAEWTLRPDDRIMQGAHDSDEPHPNAHRIKAVAPISRGIRRVDHWEVSG